MEELLLCERPNGSFIFQPVSLYLLWVDSYVSLPSTMQRTAAITFTTNNNNQKAAVVELHFHVLLTLILDSVTHVVVVNQMEHLFIIIRTL